MLRGLEISDCELRNDDVVPGEEHQPYADQELRTNRFNQDLEDWARRMEYDSSGGDGWAWQGAMDLSVD